MVKKLTVMIPDDLHKKLKVAAAIESTSITSIVIAAIEERLDPKLKGAKFLDMPLDDKPVVIVGKANMNESEIKVKKRGEKNQLVKPVKA